jgi:hypothetical protein
MGDHHETVSVDAVGRALRVPVNVANVKVPAHSVQAREKQLIFKQMNYGGVVSVRVDVSKVLGSSPHPQGEDQDVPVIYNFAAKCRSQSSNTLIDVSQYPGGRINVRVSHYDQPRGARRSANNIVPFP